MHEFRDKRVMGMHFGVAVLKLKSNERELAKKNAVFWTTFFFIDP